MIKKIERNDEIEIGIRNEKGGFWVLKTKKILIDKDNFVILANNTEIEMEGIDYIKIPAKNHRYACDSWVLGSIVKAHRDPTPLEIKRGCGAIHYRDFEIFDFLREDGTLKKWIKCPADGLRYYR